MCSWGDLGGVQVGDIWGGEVRIHLEAEPVFLAGWVWLGSGKAFGHSSRRTRQKPKTMTTASIKMGRCGDGCESSQVPSDIRQPPWVSQLAWQGQGQGQGLRLGCGRGLLVALTGRPSGPSTLEKQPPQASRVPPRRRGKGCACWVPGSRTGGQPTGPPVLGVRGGEAGRRSSQPGQCGVPGTQEPDPS